MSGSCYDHPQYWDLAFRDETRLEADFVQAAVRKYCDFPVRRVLEPGCGGGRLVVELAARGYNAIGYDLSTPAINYLRRRLNRRGLTAEVFEGKHDDRAGQSTDRPGHLPDEHLPAPDK